MRDAGHRTPDGRKSKNNISTPQGGGHNYGVQDKYLKNETHNQYKYHTID